MRTNHLDDTPTEEALAVSVLRYRRLFETAKDGILILDTETGMVVDVKPFLVNLLGWRLKAVSARGADPGRPVPFR